MVEHGALLFPLENGRSPMYKPPLFHWTATLIDHVAGIKKVTAGNLRFTSALYAIAGVALTVAFAASFLGPGPACLAGLILCGAYQYIEQGRIGRVDMTLTFFETLALFAFLWWFAPQPATVSDSALLARPSAESGEAAELPLRGGEGPTGKNQRFGVRQFLLLTKRRAQNPAPPSSIPTPDRQELGHSPFLTPQDLPPTGQRHGILRYLFALALGLATLAKGPVGAFLPAAACGLFLVLEKRLADLRKIAAPGPVLLALMVGGSWYAACLFGQRYGFLHRQIGSENFGRFFGALGAMAPWYYLEPLLLNSVPLSLLVPFAVYFVLRPYWRDNPPAQPDPRIVFNDGTRAGAAVRLLAIFWIVTVAFFSIAAYKRRAYLLPLWPPSAVILSWWLERIARNSNASRYLRDAVAATCIGLTLFNFIYLPLKEVRECDGDSFKTAAAQINHIVGPGEPLASFGLGDEPAPFLFYLDRDAPPIDGKLGDAPPGYVIVPAEVWAAQRHEALDLEPIYESSSGREKLVLLRHGKAYARR
jgi:4-amino-4-deoxy-L-arabinose transferase-like glycosyltransferase